MLRNRLDFITAQNLKSFSGLGVNAYLIALEAWRRGLEVEFHYSIDENIEKAPFLKSTTSGINGELFSIKDKDKKVFFNRALSHLTSKEASDVSNCKQKTKERLRSKQVNTPKSLIVNKDINVENFLKDSKSLFVIKPLNESAGKGVVKNLTDKDVENKVKEIKSDMILEEQIEGREFRVYLVGNKYISSFERIPANVVGDGVKKVKTLIDEKSNIKKQHPIYKENDMVNKNEILKYHFEKYGKNLFDYVPKDGERIYLTEINSIHNGGDVIDSTENIPKEVIEEAIKADKAVGLNVSGIDIILDKNNVPYVLEVNQNPFFRLFSYPLKGAIDEPFNDIAKGIVDYYFPKSKTIEHLNKVNFDFNEIKVALSYNSISSVKLPMLNKNFIHKQLKVQIGGNKKNEILKNIMLNSYAHKTYIKIFEFDNDIVIDFIALKDNWEILSNILKIK